jgi:ribosomal protein S18 acetylase RimI-like enzyme
MNKETLIRPLKQSETGILPTMLYNAIFIPEGSEKLPFEIINHPKISVYIRDFGREGDLCLVAEADGEIVGAIWTRHFSDNDKGYGFVDSETPELSMSVIGEFRGRGIGTRLLDEMIKLLTFKGYEQVSLSVDVANFAYGLYKKHGFEDYLLVEESMTMVKKIRHLSHYSQ